MNGYFVDIALCLDTTGAMNAFLYMLQCGQEPFPKTLLKALEKRVSSEVKLRLRVIAYKDFYRDGERALLESSFFSIPEELSEYKAFLEGIYASGGGDIPEDSLEAFATALKSDWTPNNGDAKVRHIIFIATDAPAHSFGSHAESLYYPQELPKDEQELARWWNEGVPNGTFSPKAGRIAVLAPKSYPWDQMTEKHNVWVDFDDSAGLNNMEMQRVVDLLAEAAFGQSVY